MIQVYNSTHERSKLRIYCTLHFISDCQYDPDGESSDETLRNELKEDRSEGEEFSRENSDFALDFVRLSFQHGFKLYTRDVRSRSEEKGLGWCFFHTHAEGELCHLEGVVESLDDEDWDE
jgi:hypothetical protein